MEKKIFFVCTYQLLLFLCRSAQGTVCTLCVCAVINMPLAAIATGYRSIWKIVLDGLCNNSDNEIIMISTMILYYQRYQDNNKPP